MAMPMPTMVTSAAITSVLPNVRRYVSLAKKRW